MLLILYKLGSYVNISYQMSPVGKSGEEGPIIIKFWSVLDNKYNKFESTSFSGVYFATHSTASLGYCQPGRSGKKKMFLARVLVGLSTQSNPSYRRPPVNKKTGRLFDSVCNGQDMNNASVYVVFDQMQFYPEYILEIS